MYGQYHQEDSSNLWLYGRRMNSFGSQRMMQECDMPGSFLFVIAIALLRLSFGGASWSSAL